MRDNEPKMQILDLSMTIIIFTVGCVVGKLCMSYNDTWIAFDFPAIVTFAIGELVWWRLRNKIVNLIEVKADARNSRTPKGKS